MRYRSRGLIRNIISITSLRNQEKTGINLQEPACRWRSKRHLHCILGTHNSVLNRKLRQDYGAYAFRRHNAAKGKKFVIIVRMGCGGKNHSGSPEIREQVFQVIFFRFLRHSLLQSLFLNFTCGLGSLHKAIPGNDNLLFTGRETGINGLVELTNLYF